MSNAMERVKEAVRRSGLTYRDTRDGITSQCANPFHEDKTPSLDIKHNGRDGLLMLCRVCGKEATPDIVAALGLTMADLFDDPKQKVERPTGRPSRPKVVDTYVYENSDGQEAYRRDRREPGKDGKSKDFVQYRIVDGTKVWGLGDVERYPWHLPQLLQGIRDGRPVYWVEGEKSVRALEDTGEIATTSGGAQDWRPGMAKWFAGAGQVVIIADNDAPGLAHAQAVAEHLRPVVGHVRIVRGAVDEPKADVVEHLAAGHTVEDLVEVAETEGARRPDLRVVGGTDGANALAAEAEESPNVGRPEVGYNFAQAFGLPREVTVPTGYRVRHNEVAARKLVGDEEKWLRVAYAPIAVTRTFHDSDDEQSIELSWLDRGKVVSRVVPREVAKRGRELVKQLGNANLPVIEVDARQLERYLAEFELTNRKHIPDEYLARWLGWQPNGTFVASPHGDVKVEVLHDEQRARARAFDQHGTLQGWQDAVKELDGYQVPRVVVAASLAASLLRPLGLSSFTIDVSSRSTKGKTTCLQCGLSVWANPSEQADAMANWRTTLFAIEKTLNLVRGLVTVLDETMAVDDETLIDQVLYQLPMNHGKSRSGGYASMLPWETILLSSGEQPALSFTTAQGAAARILGTTRPPFGDNGGDVAVRARDGVLANYGHAGPAFVEQLRRGLATQGGPERLKQRHQELRDQFKGTNDMTARRAPMVASLALAEELACKWKILPYEPMPAEAWRRLFAADSPTDNRPEMAMDVVREYIAGHAWELWPGETDRPPLHGWLGAEKQVNGETRIALMPERLKKILADAGYKLDAVEQSWVASGYLELSKTQKPAHKIPVRINGKQARCYVFTKAALESPDTTQETL